MYGYDYVDYGSYATSGLTGGYGVGMGYLVFVALTMAIGGLASWYVNKMIKQYVSVPASTGVTGAEMAKRMLAAHGITNVPVVQGGSGVDHFDPRNNSITLDPDAFGGTSITAIATACHEAGHACQYAQGYLPMKVRSALVPAVNLASNAWVFLLMIGIALQLSGLTDLAIIMYAVVFLFQVVTLPVEFNASRRGLAYLKTTGISAQEEHECFSVLRACALTYVAAALASLLQLLYLLLQQRHD